MRAKRKTIASLEDLLKETGRTRGREDRRVIRESRIPVKDTAVSTEHTDTPPQQMQHPTKFFVMGPDGLCVEYPYKPRMTIQELKRDLKPTFASRRSTRTSRSMNSSSTNTIKIIYQGKVLLDDNTMEDCHIRDGDTLVAIVERDVVDSFDGEEEDKKRAQYVPTPVQQQESNQNRDSSIHLELLGKQTELINTMRYKTVYDRVTSFLIIT